MLTSAQQVPVALTLSAVTLLVHTHALAMMVMQKMVMHAQVSIE